MAWWQYPALTGLGLLAGVINVMAGGGSLITLPAMIFFGFSPALANGTNRVALVVQNAVAVHGFARQGFSELKRSLKLAIWTIPGAVIGALVAIAIDPVWFKRLLALVMFGALLATLKKPSSLAGDGAGPSDRSRVWLASGGMVAIGFYGGFVQAGVGFLIMALLRRVLALDLLRVNMHKVFVVGVYMLPSLLVFALQNQVNWPAGAMLALGNAAGAWFATRWQVKRGEGLVRIVLVVSVMAMAVRLLCG